MKVTEYWNCQGIPRGEIKAVWANYSWPSAKAGAAELSKRFPHKLAYHDACEVVFKENLYVQRIVFSDSPE